MAQSEFPIGLNDATPPIDIPKGHIGPVVLPGTQREVWWTGRVAIGLRYERQGRQGPLGQSAEWVQRLMLAGRGRDRPAT